MGEQQTQPSFSPIAGLGAAVVALLVLETVGTAAAMALGHPELALPLPAAGAVVDQLAVARGVLGLAAGITFLVWFSRAYRNLDAFGEPRDHGVGWAAGAFFVPLLNLFRPYRIAKEIYVKSAQGTGEERERGARAVVLTWWLAWLFGDGAYLSGSVNTNVTAFLYVAAGVMAIFIVRTISRRQTLRAGREAEAVPTTF